MICFTISEKGTTRCTFLRSESCTRTPKMTTMCTKNALEFLVYSALKSPSCKLVFFYRYGPLYTYQSQKLLSNEVYAILLWAVIAYLLKECLTCNCEWCWYCFWILHAFQKLTTNSINILQFKQMMNLTLCLWNKVSLCLVSEIRFSLFSSLEKQNH